MQYTFPDSYDTAPCFLVPINAALIPLVAGQLRLFEHRGSWVSEADYERGYEAFAALQASMTQLCVDRLIESNDRLYRLLDAALYGRTYSVVATDPLEIAPAIPAVPDVTLAPAGLLAMTDALPGVLDAGWFGIGGHKATFADVVTALRVGKAESADSIVQQLESILGAGGNVAQIGELITEAFTGGVQDLEEGGILVLLATSIVGNLAAMGALSTQITSMMTQIQRIINSIDGGAFPGPQDNILKAIRGTTPADDTRNIIDALITGLAANNSDNSDLLAKLEEIRALLV